MSAAVKCRRRTDGDGPVGSRMSADQEERVVATLVRANEIVQQVSVLAYGRIAVRQFRRDYAAGKLTTYLSRSQRAVLDAALATEGEVLVGYDQMARLLANRSAAGCGIPFEDLHQEALSAIVLALLGYNGSQKLSTYLWYVVERHLVDCVRSEGRRRDGVSYDPGEHDCPAPQPAPSYDGYDLEMLRRAMACTRLTPHERAAFGVLLGDVPRDTDRLVNPATGRRLCRATVSNLQRDARAKIRAVYDSMERRANSRITEVA